MQRHSHAIRFLVVLLALAAAAMTLGAKEAAYATGFKGFQAANGGFDGWTLSGVQLNAGALELDQATAMQKTDSYPAGGYYGHNYYNGGSFLLGEATSPEIATFASQEAIASWNAQTPDGTWIETELQAKIGDRWTKWYSMGTWASGTGTVERHSVRLQGDADGYVAVDTLVITSKAGPATVYRLKLSLFSATGVTATPTVSLASLAYSNTAPKKTKVSAGNSSNWNTLLAVPECSQMVYPDGGNVWCSPTSTSMVLGFWGIDPGPCEPRVRAAVAGVYDWLYDGHGNWPFNTAYAASRGMVAQVARFTSLDDVEKWVKAGVPVVVSFAWKKSELTGAAVSSSNGHLSVIVGFDTQGNPIVNDPAAATDEDVQRTYLRSEFEPLWLTNSGGTVYLIYPPGTAVPTLE
ncbi:MAG: peptidase C39 family protein [Rudaea sp.]